MTTRVPNAAAEGWWLADSCGGKCAVSIWLDSHDGSLRTFDPLAFKVVSVDSIDPGRWLGPVAPPVGEGEVMVRMSKQSAREWLEVEETNATNPSSNPAAAAETRALIAALRAALEQS